MKRNSANLGGSRKISGWMWTGLLAAGALVTGCDDVVVVDRHCYDALPPVGLYSITGDEEVTVYWIPVAEDDVSEFLVYRATSEGGVYREIGHTTREYFVDRDVVNGRTYFYAVSAVNHCGYETELSREIAYDTPRPEGFGDRIYDAAGSEWRRSAWEFDAYRTVPWDYPDADIYFIWSDRTPLLVATDLNTDIQDAGYAGFDDVTWAPTEGWSPTGTAEAIPGHVYIVWTRDNHFAKVRVRSVNGDSVVFDWAYQIDTGNPELAPRPARESIPLSVNPGRGA